jgi:hypothetical protein
MKRVFLGMAATLLFIASLALAPEESGATPEDVIRDETEAGRVKQQFLAVTDGWAREVVFKKSETEAMARGRAWEDLMMTGLDDPLARKILAAGEPSYDALTSYYPGKILDRTVLGTYSDPGSPARGSQNEFVIWWNGALSAHLIEGRLRSAVQPVAHNTNVVFRVGAEAEMFGRYRDKYSHIYYEDGYLPIVRARYEAGGVRYEETALAAAPAGELPEEDTAFIRFQIINVSTVPCVAELHEDLILFQKPQVTSSKQKILDQDGALILTHSDPQAAFDAQKSRLSHRFALKAGEQRTVYFKIPYLPDSAGRTKPANAESFDAVYTEARQFWISLLARGLKINVPEERVNQVWRALLLQNFVLADGPRMTYSSGLRYNKNYYPVESGLAGNDFAFYGFGDYSHALLPQCMQVSLSPQTAGRKYQNRRGVALRQLYENYRLTRKADVFNQYREDLLRVAEEIIKDRHTTMVTVGKRPLHWGLLPPDRPAADYLGETTSMYVVAHDITNSQGLQDFGYFLVRSGLDQPRGERYIKEARAFRADILAAMEKSTIRSAGRPPFVPLQTLYHRETPGYGPEPYDNLALGRVEGTYYHYWADMELKYDFLNPDDKVAQWIVDYLEKMGGFVLGCTRARNQSGQEYGWINNVYNAGYYMHRLREGEIDKFLLGFYARLAFGMSRHVYVASEGSPFIRYNTKDGGPVSADYSFPNSAANAETLRMFRMMLVMEELKDNVETGDLYLARGAPRPWFADGKTIEVTDAPTFFGKTSFAIHSHVGKGVITAQIKPPRQDNYRSIVISFRHPEKTTIRKVKVNGREHTEFDAKKEWVRLPYGPSEFKVEVFY